MKATLHFTLPEDSSEHQLALNGSKYYCTIQAVLGKIRDKVKYETLSEEQIKILEEIRDLILDEEDFMEIE